jgi:bifunctional oligoribonuclease and PAP phosphatase NrnA
MSDRIDGLIAQRLHEADRILIVSHIRPDGDAVGSLLGLGLALQESGKSVQMVLEDGVPSPFRLLFGSNQIVRHPSGMFDLAVVVDCSDLERVGGGLNGVTRPDLVIDHHITNLKFGEINLVEPTSVATCAILAEHLPLWNLPVNGAISSALLTGMISDSLGFRTSNMNPQALRLAAELMEKGANLPELYQRALGRHSFEAACYWGAGLDRLERDDRIIWTHLALPDREKASYPGNDDADLINLLSSIEGADVVIIFVEQKNGHVKVSWRSQPGVDVSQLALSFGGGGHPAASGADIRGTLEEVKAKVLEATRILLK